MNDYPPDWDQIANKIKSDAGWKCEHCGHTHDPQTGHTLTTHHLNGDKADCRKENLVALCQRCHLSIQARYAPGQQWLFDPPTWAVTRNLCQIT